MDQDELQLRCAAFTLVEVMVVVLVLAIAGALAAPMLGQTADTQLVSAAKLLAGDLGYAKVQSITHGDQPRVIVFDSADNSYHIATRDAADTPVTNPTTKHDYVVRFGEGQAASLDDVTIDSYSLDGDDQLEFGIYGELDQGNAATITLAANGRQITVTVDPVNGEASIGDITSD